MCMEDVRLGRETAHDTITVTVANGQSARILPPDRNRTAVIIGNPSATVGTLMFGPTRPSATIGYQVHELVAPLILTVMQHGSIVTDELWGFADGADVTFTVTYAYLGKQ